uniref:Probable U2 small nuclear ribonucleoprotein A' n=1 Tax=Hyalomma excavatum TaxID=257692 RepID=A0A131XKV6_9ACAR
MVKLSQDLIQMAAQSINPVRDREIDLRGYKIPVIENLGATLDQFDCIDLSDNDIRKLDGFPLLKRLKSLMLNNNRICRIAENLQEHLPALETLVLTNNQIQNLGDLDPLASIKTLTYLSLMKNPVTVKRHYRHYIIHRIPQLRVLDFRRIKQKERLEAQQLFKGKKGKQLEKEVGVVSGGGGAGPIRNSTAAAAASSSQPPPPGAGPTPPSSTSRSGQLEALKQAMSRATTLDQVEHLSSALQSGAPLLPTTKSSSSSTRPPGTEDVEMEETNGH